MKSALAMVWWWSTLAAPVVDSVRLENETVAVQVTPELGGRGLSFSLRGHPNLLKVGAPLYGQSPPEASATGEDIGYLGHDVWVGPQQDWWRYQDLNPARRDAAANWPPDPFLAYAETRVVERTPTRLVLEGVDSPVSGVRLRKTYALSDKNPETVEVGVSARNIRDQAVAWDLWFNTRTPGATRVYVPVESAADVRVESFVGVDIGPVQTRIENGLLRFEREPLVEGMVARRGKVFVQPAAGWMAGFSGGQVLIVRFPHHPRTSIHPAQGQVELYLDDHRDPDQALLEMEVHAPYRRLAPGAEMHADERWSALRYEGADDPAAHAAFLCEVAAPRLQAPELCVSSPSALSPGAAQVVGMPEENAADRGD